MQIPDLTSPKVLYPALLFGLMKTFMDIGPFGFGIIYYIILKYVARVTFKPTDIMVPSLMYFVLTPAKFFILAKGEKAIAIHSVVYLIGLAFIRTLFPFVF